jgi:hypothetical protein
MERRPRKEIKWRAAPIIYFLFGGSDDYFVVDDLKLPFRNRDSGRKNGSRS